RIGVEPDVIAHRLDGIQHRLRGAGAERDGPQSLRRVELDPDHREPLAPGQQGRRILAFGRRSNGYRARAGEVVAIDIGLAAATRGVVEALAVRREKGLVVITRTRGHVDGLAYRERAPLTRKRRNVDVGAGSLRGQGLGSSEQTQNYSPQSTPITPITK